MLGLLLGVTLMMYESADALASVEIGDAVAEAQNECAECHAPEAPLRCTRCKVAKYCNAECQKKANKLHRQPCKAAINGEPLHETIIKATEEAGTGRGARLQAFHNWFRNLESLWAQVLAHSDEKLGLRPSCGLPGGYRAAFLQHLAQEHEKAHLKLKEFSDRELCPNDQAAFRLDIAGLPTPNKSE